MKADTGSLTASSTAWLNQWSEPTLVETIVKDESIELIYFQYPTVTFSYHSAPKNICFKIIYSCIDGKWNKSEPIYGEVIPASKETYEFND